MKHAVAFVLVLGAAAVCASALLHSRSANAELENSIFTSKADRIRLVIPRGWRATDQPSYPGLLLWMMRSEPEGRIVLTSEPFTRDVYCSWPVRCQMSHDSLPAKLACALGSKLTGRSTRVGPVQAGPKENEDAGMPSVWFEYDDGHHFMRQAVAIDQDRVVSLVLSAPSVEARNAHVRAFEQALRTLRPLNAQEMGAPAPATGSAGSAAAGSASARSAAAGSASAGSASAGSASAGTASPGSAAPGSASPGSASAGSASPGSASPGSGAGGTGPGSGAGGTGPGSGAGAGSGSGAGSAVPMPYQSAPPPPLSPIGPCTNR